MLRRELKFANDTRTATTMGLTITADGVLEAATHGRAPSRGSKATGTRRNSAGSQQAFGASYGSGAGGGVPRGNSAGPAAEDGFSPEDAREIEMQHQQIQQVRGCDWFCAVCCRRFHAMHATHTACVRQLREHLSRLRMAAGLDPMTSQSRPRSVNSRERLPPVDAANMGGGVVGASMSPVGRSSRGEGKEAQPETAFA